MADVGETAAAMRAVLESIGRGELTASKIEQARLEGAVAALEALTEADASELPD